jgi:hypothetical protein
MATPRKRSSKHSSRQRSLWTFPLQWIRDLSTEATLFKRNMLRSVPFDAQEFFEIIGLLRWKSIDSKVPEPRWKARAYKQPRNTTVAARGNIHPRCRIHIRVEYFASSNPLSPPLCPVRIYLCEFLSRDRRRSRSQRLKTLCHLFDLRTPVTSLDSVKGTRKQKPHRCLQSYDLSLDFFIS